MRSLLLLRGGESGNHLRYWSCNDFYDLLTNLLTSKLLYLDPSFTYHQRIIASIVVPCCRTGPKHHSFHIPITFVASFVSTNTDTYRRIIAMAGPESTTKHTVPLTCHGHSRPVTHLSFSGFVGEDEYYLISACKGEFCQMFSRALLTDCRQQSYASRWCDWRLVCYRMSGELYTCL